MKALKWINTGAFVLMVGVNALAELLPIGGRTTGQISELYPNLFTPAPITFAIWGLIYFLLMLFTLYQHGALDGERQSVKVREKIGLWFSVSCGLNILWVFLWHYQLLGLSVLCIALLLIVLIIIEKRLNQLKENENLLQRVTTGVGFSLYYGWIIAATIANISVFLTQSGWNGWGLSADFWTVAVLLIGAVVAGAVAMVERNWIAAAAVMWAYAGILIRHISPAYFGGTHPYVIAAGVISEGLMLTAILLPRLKTCRKSMSAVCR